MVNNKKYVELFWHQKYDKMGLGGKMPIERPNLPFQTVETPGCVKTHVCMKNKPYIL